MPNPTPKLQALIDAVRPVAQYASHYRHDDYAVAIPVRSELLIALADALAEYDIEEGEGHGTSDAG